MNLFRSEDHVRRWAQLASDPDEGTIRLEDLVAVFSTPNRRHLLDGDYMSRWLPLRGPERRSALERIGKATPLWPGQTY
jgi:hypothetical protein